VWYMYTMKYYSAFENGMKFWSILQYGWTLKHAKRNKPVTKGPYCIFPIV
jgi:hypothetical protein